MSKMPWCHRRNDTLKGVNKHGRMEGFVEKWYLNICVSFAVSHTGLSLPSFYTVLVFFFQAYFTPYNRLQMFRMDFWTLWERERVGWFGRMALKHVYYHVRNESPVSVQYRIQDAWGWCMGMIQRDNMGWEVGGGFRIGNSCTPVADSCQCMAKPIQYYKAK